MDKQILNSLNKGEHLVEMQEYILHNQSIYQVTIYTCIGKTIFRKNKIEKYIFPFYFYSKDLATDFLKYWDDIWLTNTSYWGNSKNNHCFGLYVNNGKTYQMVDEFKQRFDSTNKCHLTYNGVWNGLICRNGKYFTYNNDNFYFTHIFEMEDFPQKTNTVPYVFKMIKD